MNISFYTLGCKLNQAETEELKKDLVKRGFFVVPFDSGEDIAVIRACGVTCGASQSTREMIRRVKRKGAYVIAMGCLEDKNLEEIDFVGGSNEEVVNVIASEASQSRGTKTTLNPRDCDASLAMTSRTRQFIKIQTGCNFQCAYCIIPTFRGKSKSVPVEEVIKKVNQAVEDGYKEVVLTGVNICQYKEKPNTNLVDLLDQILQKTKIQRIRLGSLDPRLITDNLIKLYTQELNNRLLPHWHLSLQSGSNNVLKQMARGYTTQHYEKLVNKLCVHNPLFSFTTDIIVGFPGETDEGFEETYNFVKKIKFSKVHIFPYSPRPGTPAAKLKFVHNQTVTDRVKKLTLICNQVANEYAQQFIGLTRPVLFEFERRGVLQYAPTWHGYTPEYVRVKFESEENLENKIKDVKMNDEMINL